MKNQPAVHFVGIGGIGMSSLARFFLSKKYRVSGSDIAKSNELKGLRRERAAVYVGHRASNVPSKVSILIHSQAATKDNPEIKKAKHLGIPVLSYPQALGKLTEKYFTVAVAGSHGKSTTTALSALALIKGKFDPTVIIGTKLKEFGGRNFRAGKSPWLVVEADEFGKAFLNYSPLVSIVTNIDREHLDTYRNISGVKNAFLQFLSNTRPSGALILNRDDKNLCSLQPRISRLAKRKKLKVVWYSLKDRSNAALVRKNIQIPGEHNVSNALAILALASVLGIQKKISLSAIGSYRGSWRRLEYKGTCRMSHVACRMYDDYAHHPTEIKATLKALREKYPKSALVCVFQPHQRERLRLLFKEFRSAFEDAHITLILPLYRVAGREKAATGPDSEALVRAIRQAASGKMVFYLEKPENLKKALNVLIAGIDTSKNAKQCPFPGAKFYPLKSAVVVMMGAGDIFTYTPLLLD